MRDLHDLQTDFQNYLLHQQPNIISQIIHTEKVSTETRLGIYLEAYYLRLIEALQQDFSVLQTLMGDDQFDMICRQYIDAHPSHFRSVRWFGSQFAHFIKEANFFQDQPWLIETAEFEWALMKAFDASDNHVVLIDEMAVIPFEKWSELTFTLHASVQRLNLNWNITSFWNGSVDESTQPQKTDLVSWLIWRKEHEVQFCPLTVDEVYMIDAMHTDKDFGSICEGLCEWVDEEQVAIHAASLLKRFILDGLICQIHQ